MKTENVLKKLLSIPSYPIADFNVPTTTEKIATSGEEGLVDFIENFIRKNCPFLKISKDNVFGKRYNVIASDCGIDKAKIIFCCHLDTVFPKNKQLKNGKLLVRETGERIYGLGSVDMKGGIASLLSCLAGLKKPTNGLAVIFYCDEEFSFLGMKQIIKRKKIGAKLAIFCEPTDLKIANGCRGLIEFSGYIKGKTAHASTPRLGNNAIILTMNAFRALKKEISKYRHPRLGASVCNLAGIIGGLNSPQKKEEKAIIWSGNNIPDIARVLIEIRTSVSGLDSARAVKLFKNLIKENKGTFDLADVKHSLGSFFVNPERFKLVERAIKNTGEQIHYLDLSKTGYYDSEMFYRRFRVPCVSLGPGPMYKAHQEDEYVEIKSLNKIKAIYQEILKLYKII